MGVNQNQIRKLYFTTVSAVESSIGRQGIFCICEEAETLYRYETSGSSYTINGRSVLQTGDGGNTRWLGVGGRYGKVTLTEIEHLDATSGSETLTDADLNKIYYIEAAATPTTITIPDPSIANETYFVRLYKESGDGDITVETTTGQPIIGASSQNIVYDGQGFYIKSDDASAWLALQDSRSDIPVSITITSDYGSGENWQFDNMLADTSSSSLIATFPSDISSFPEGAERKIFNIGTNELYIYPNGNPIDGSTADRVIAPDGFITLKKIDGEVRIIGGSDYYFDVEPDDVSNLELWLDANDASTITKDGSNLVSQWVDKSTNAHTFTAGVGERPLWVDAEQNNKPTIQFDGIDDVMSAGDQEIANNTRGLTMIAVVKNTTTKRQCVLSKYDTTLDQRQFSFGEDINYLFEDGTFGSQTSANLTLDVNEYQIIEFVWDPGQAFKLFNNGTLQDTGTAAVTDLTDVTSNLKLGGGDYTPVGFWEGNFAEVIAYSDALSETDRDNLRNNLAVKWNVADVVITSNIKYWSRDSDTSTLSPVTADDNVDVGAGNLITTGYVGRDADNNIDFGTDNQIDITISGVTTSISSISTGTTDNDKLITQGYLRDNVRKRFTGNYGGNAPTLDSSDGVEVGDVAVDTSVTVDKFWTCLDETLGSPVWVRIYDQENVFHVGSDQYYTSVQDAIDDASSGDLVVIDAGTYVEDITLKDGVTVKGVCASKSIIQGQVSFGSSGLSVIAYLNIETTNENCIEMSGTGRLSIVRCSLEGTWTADTGQAVNTSKCAIHQTAGIVNVRLLTQIKVEKTVVAGVSTNEHNISAYWISGSNECRLESFGTRHEISNTLDNQQNLEILFSNNTNTNSELIVKNGFCFITGTVNTSNYIAPFYMYEGDSAGQIDGNYIELKDSGHCYLAYCYNSDSIVYFTKNTILPSNITDINFATTAGTGSSEVRAADNYFDHTSATIAGNVIQTTTLEDGSMLISGDIEVDGDIDIGGDILFDTLTVSSVSTGSADNDKFVTQGYVDDLVADTVYQNVVRVSPNGNLDYTSIKSAIDSISGNSSTSRWLVQVGPGIYSEDPIAMKEYVDVISLTGPLQTVIAATTSGSNLITFAGSSSFRGFTLTGTPSASLMNMAQAGKTQLVEYIFCYNASVGLEITNGYVLGTQINALYVPTTTVSTFIKMTGSGSGTLKSLGTAETASGTNTFFASGTSVKATIHGARFTASVTNAFNINGSHLELVDVTILNATNGLYLDGACELSCDTIHMDETTTYHANIQSTSSVLKVAGGEVDRNRLIVPAGYTAETAMFIDSSDGAILMWGDTTVGRPMNPSRFTCGDGQEYNSGLKIYTTDNTATSTVDGGNLTDVTTAAQSASGSTFTFQGTGANYSFLITTQYGTPTDMLKIAAMEFVQTTAAVEVTAKSFAFEYWDGSAWTEIGTYAISKDELYRYGNSLFIRANSEEFVMFPQFPDWTKKTISGLNAYWLRIRITTALTTAPVFQQLWLEHNFSRFNIQGQQYFVGEAKFKAALVGGGNIFGESGGVGSGIYAVGSGGLPTGWDHSVKNCVLNGAGDAVYFQGTIPRGFCTACPVQVRVTLLCISNSASTDATFIVSFIPIEKAGVLVADPSGGKTPIARTLANTETLTAKAGHYSSHSVTADTTAYNKYQLLTSDYFYIQDHYENDVINIRVEMDNAGSGNQDFVVWAVEVVGAKWTHGENL